MSKRINADPQLTVPQQHAVKATMAWTQWLKTATKATLEAGPRSLFEAGFQAALTVREETQADSLSDFPVEALEALRELVMPLEELPDSDRLLRLIEKALEVKRRRL
jgi:hypothetical protein